MNKKTFFAATFLTLAACSSSPDHDVEVRDATALDAGVTAIDSGGNLLDAAANAADAEVDFLPAPPPGQGVQFKLVTTLGPGVEDRLCQFYQVPPEGLWVTKEEMRYRGGGHHSTTWKTSYTSIPTEDLHGNPVDLTHGPISCDKDGVSGDWNIGDIIATGQAADFHTGTVSLPEGVAVHIPGNTVLITVGHFLNPGSTTAVAEARLNLWTTPPESVKVEAAIYQFYNPFIRVPAMGASSARMSCPVPADVNIVNAQTHMHARGVATTANVIEADGGTKPFYTGGYWDDVTVKAFSPPMLLSAGSTIDYRCDFENSKNSTVLQGPYASDEMCVISGFYYPVNTAFANCATDGVAAHYSNAATYIGTGTATCVESLACVTAAAPLAQDKGDQLFGCMINSCPKVAKELTAAFNCMLSRGAGACQAQCPAGAAPTLDCGKCVKAACSAQASACAEATCN
ncbi:MAG: hypothetical protein JWN04_5583 [Myxococcaceae bacterium]|nr:hypothetical protein [Myxococcaceae bacterium]